MNIILIGMMGSGKSTIGKELSKELNLELIDTDDLIEHRADMNIKDIFEIHGESHFRRLEKSTFKELANLDNTIISTGGGAVLGDTLAPVNGQCIVYLKWNIEGLLSNLTNKVDNRPLLSNDSLKEKLSTIFNTRKDLYERCAEHIIDCNNKSVEEIVTLILKLHK